MLKETPETIFSNFEDLIQPRLRHSPHIRLPCDNIPDQCILVYKYLTDDLLSLIPRGCSTEARRQMLVAALQGISELHSRDVVHLRKLTPACCATRILMRPDVKPDNIMVDYRQEKDRIAIERVQIIDFENAAYLPKGRRLKGMLVGNENWRSPESHLRGELNKPTDMFSFGAVVVVSHFTRV